MSLDPTGLPACTTEDGSDPAQTFPCQWDATTAGNGVGRSFVMPAPDTYVYADGWLECPAFTMANDALDGCVALPALTTAPAAAPAALTSAPATQLAATGTDPLGWLTAALILSAGVALVRTSRRHLS